MTANQIKTGAMLMGLAIAGLFAVKVYGRMTAMKDSLQSAGSLMADAVTSAPDRITQAVTDTVNEVKSSLGLSTNDWTMPADYNAKELSFGQWSANTVATINALNKTRGINRQWKNAGDFVGWKVFSDGTIISPDGYYFSSKTNVAAGAFSDFNAAGDLAVNVNQVYSPFGQDFDQTRYQWQLAQE